jgi:hypothetical protein
LSSGVVEEGERLVGTGIQRAHDDLLAGKPAAARCSLRLLLDGRRLRRREEEELGAEEAHALGAELDGLGGAAGLAEVRQRGTAVPSLRAPG